MEKLVKINPNGLQHYNQNCNVKIGPAYFQPRTRSLFLDSFYVWSRITVASCFLFSLIRRNYRLSTYAKIFGTFYALDNTIPFSVFYFNESFRLSNLKRYAKVYYEKQNGNMERIQFILDPSTPISKLRTFYL
jgi:hypothetical protein